MVNTESQYQDEKNKIIGNIAILRDAICVVFKLIQVNGYFRLDYVLKKMLEDAETRRDQTNPYLLGFGDSELTNIDEVILLEHFDIRLVESEN